MRLQGSSLAQALTLAAAASAALTLAACNKSKPAAGDDTEPATAPSTSAQIAAARDSVSHGRDAGPMAAGIPVPALKVELTLNPEHKPAYDGPKGSIEGVVKVKGDAAPSLVGAIPDDCADAKTTFGKLFREGEGRTVADVLVAVTKFDAYIPSRKVAQPVKIKGCAFDSRTYVLTYGERLEVENGDAVPFLPVLRGSRSETQNVAAPGAGAVKLYPTEVGHYLLEDGMKHPWMRSDVFVLRYPTHAVTAVDGKYRLDGVPAGKVTLSALLPSINKHLDRDVEVPAGGVAKVDIELEFDAKKDMPTAPAPSAPASAAPAGSGAR